MQIWHAKFPFPICENSGKTSPSKQNPSCAPKKLPTVMGGKQVASKDLTRASL